MVSNVTVTSKQQSSDVKFLDSLIQKQIVVTDKRTDVWSRDFMIWKINFELWAVARGGLWHKRVWADYEQLLRTVFSLFWGQKKI